MAGQGLREYPGQRALHCELDGPTLLSQSM